MSLSQRPRPLVARRAGSTRGALVWTALVLSVAVVCGLAGVAAAQDAPEPAKPKAPASSDTTKAATKAKTSKKIKRTPFSLLDPGRMEFGANLAGVWSRNTAAPEGQDEITQSTTYFNPSLYVGLTVVDNVQVRLQGGWQRISSSVNDVDTQNSSSGQFVVQGLYHLGLESGFALYGGAGLGGYFGTTERTLSVESESLTAQNDTSGFMFQVLGGLLTQPLERLTIRTGLRLDGLIGSEASDAPDYPAQTDNSNYQLLLEVAVGVRFGSAW